jgi:hypothetical protein
MKIYPLVEGHGEVGAVPVLLRRLLALAGCHTISVGPPIRRSQAQFHSKESLQAGVGLALLQPECAAIIILFDGEDDCPKDVAENAQEWAREAAGITPCYVVVAYREYETWFIASIESLRGRYGIDANAVAPADPESRRDAKGVLEEFMPEDRAYSETGDQPGMSETFDMQMAHRRNRSFRKLVKSVGEIITATNHTLPTWPPPTW